jgi:branched-chain amino acid transport system substrate-binding protein
MKKLQSLFLLFGFMAFNAGAADIVVGQTLALSGTQGVTGKAVSAGAALYFNHVNANGGIAGNRIRFVVLDDEQKPDHSVDNARLLIEREGAVMLMNASGTANNEAIIKSGVLQRNGVAMLGPTTGAGVLYGIHEVLMLRPSYRAEAEKSVALLLSMGQTRFGVVYQKDSFGQEFVDSLEGALTKKSLKLSAKAPYERLTTKVEAAVDEMLKAPDLQAIYLAAVSVPAAAFVKQYRERGGTAQIIGPSIIDPSVVLKTAGLENARGVMMTTIMPNPSRESSPLVAEMTLLKAKYKNLDVPITSRSIEGFLSAKIVIEALRRAKGGYNGKSLTLAVRSLKDVAFGEFYLDFSDPKKGASMMMDLGIINSQGRLVQ